MNGRYNFKKRVVLVTGAGSGIGRGAAVVLAGCGARLGLLSRNREELSTLSDEVYEKGGEALVLTADISRENELQTAISELGNKWGRIDGVFANAGINGVWAPIEDLTSEDFIHTVNVNLLGTFLTIKYCRPYMKDRGGSIVITSSINGTRYFANAGSTAYSCTKAAQAAMTKLLAVEFASDDIRINAVCPGAVSSEISEHTERKGTGEIKPRKEYPDGPIPLTGKEPGKPEQVGELVAFLLSGLSSHITGSEIWIDGAQSLI